MYNSIVYLTSDLHHASSACLLWEEEKRQNKVEKVKKVKVYLQA